MNGTAGAGLPPGRLEAALDLLSSALALVDASGHIVYANGAFGDLLGLRREELKGCRLHQLVEDDPDVVDHLLSRWRSSGTSRPGGLRVSAGRDGTPFDVHCRGARIAGSDLVLFEVLHQAEAVAEFAALTREVEVTNLRRMEARLQASLAELGEANQRLAAANAELDRYASMVAHDIRTPFNAIGRFADFVVEDHGDLLPDEASEMIGAIARLSRRGAEVTDALLSLARIGRVEPVPEGTDSVVVAERVRTDLQALIDETGGEIVIGDLPPTALQAVHLERILTNLLTNALRYVPPGRRPRVEVKGDRDDGFVRFVVSDNGAGIDDEERERIFEPLVRGTAGEAHPGTGVGLATCRKIVNAYGGEIAVLASSPDGSAIGFSLPAAPV